MLQNKSLNNNIFSTQISIFLRMGIFGCLSVIVSTLIAQVNPIEGAKLNFNHILFQWESIINADLYVLEVKDMATNQFVSKKVPLPSAILKEGLTWGHQYEWKVTAFSHNKRTYVSPYRHFSILTSPKVDSSHYQHRIVKNELATDSLYIIMDNPGIIIDTKGNPVWFYPDTNVQRTFNLHLLPNGNMAALRAKGNKSGNENLAFEEISFSGKKIWKAPCTGEVSGDTTEFYHHEYQKLSNGHYLLMGNKFVTKKENTIIRYGTIMEYNQKGDIVWSWSSENYLKDEDLFAEGLKDNPSHMNAFYLDEENDHLYISFRYISRVIRLDRGTNTVTQSFGTKLPSGEAQYANDLFHLQHSPKVFDNEKFMYMYDNGTGQGKDSVSSLLILDMPKGNITCKERYRYKMQFGRGQSFSTSKGDADKMWDNLYLVDMGAVPRTTIIEAFGRGLIWQCDHFSRQHPNSPMMPMDENYRADWTQTLFPIRWDVTIGKGYREKGVRKMAKYPLVVYNHGTGGKYRVEIRDNVGAIVFSADTDFPGPESSRFITVILPKRVKKGQPIGEIVVNNLETNQEVYRVNILKK